MTKKKTSNALVLTIILAIITIDQVTKIVFLGVSRPLIGDFLWLTSIINDGAAFSILSGQRMLFIILTVAILYAMLFIIFAKRISDTIYFRVTLGILIGGIIGNFIDRFFYAGVRDFLYVKPLGFVCNIADVAITVGTIMLCIFIVFLYDKGNKLKHYNENTSNETILDDSKNEEKKNKVKKIITDNKPLTKIGDKSELSYDNENNNICITSKKEE